MRIIDRLLTLEERNYRLLWVRPHPYLRWMDYLDARKSKNDFAANFHFERLKQVVASDPQDADAHYYFGHMLQEKKEIPERAG